MTLSGFRRVMDGGARFVLATAVSLVLRYAVATPAAVYLWNSTWDQHTEVALCQSDTEAPDSSHCPWAPVAALSPLNQLLLASDENAVWTSVQDDSSNFYLAVLNVTGGLLTPYPYSALSQCLGLSMAVVPGTSGDAIAFCQTGYGTPMPAARFSLQSTTTITPLPTISPPNCLGYSLKSVVCPSPDGVGVLFIDCADMDVTLYSASLNALPHLQTVATGGGGLPGWDVACAAQRLYSVGLLPNTTTGQLGLYTVDISGSTTPAPVLLFAMPTPPGYAASAVSSVYDLHVVEKASTVVWVASVEDNGGHELNVVVACALVDDCATPRTLAAGCSAPPSYDPACSEWIDISA